MKNDKSVSGKGILNMQTDDRTTEPLELVVRTLVRS